MASRGESKTYTEGHWHEDSTAGHQQDGCQGVGQVDGGEEGEQDDEANRHEPEAEGRGCGIMDLGDACARDQMRAAHNIQGDVELVQQGDICSVDHMAWELRPALQDGEAIAQGTAAVDLHHIGVGRRWMEA